MTRKATQEPTEGLSTSEQGVGPYEARTGSSEAAGHIALSRARETEESHLATTNDQIAEWALTIRQAEGKIQDYREAIEGQRSLIADAKREQAKLKRKRRIFQVASFQLGLVDQEG